MIRTPGRRKAAPPFPSQLRMKHCKISAPAQSAEHAAVHIRPPHPLTLPPPSSAIPELAFGLDGDAVLPVSGIARHRPANSSRCQDRWETERSSNRSFRNSPDYSRVDIDSGRVTNASSPSFRCVTFGSHRPLMPASRSLIVRKGSPKAMLAPLRTIKRRGECPAPVSSCNSA